MAVLGRANAPPVPHLLPVCAGVYIAFPWQLLSFRLKTQHFWFKSEHWLIEKKKYMRVKWDFNLKSQGDLCLNKQVALKYPSCIFLHSLYISICVQYVFPFFNNNLISHVLLLHFVLLFDNHQDSCIISRV